MYFLEFSQINIVNYLSPILITIKGKEVKNGKDRVFIKKQPPVLSLGLIKLLMWNSLKISPFLLEVYSFPGFTYTLIGYDKS